MHVRTSSKRTQHIERRASMRQRGTKKEGRLREQTLRRLCTTRIILFHRGSHCLGIRIDVPSTAVRCLAQSAAAALQRRNTRRCQLPAQWAHLPRRLLSRPAPPRTPPDPRWQIGLCRGDASVARHSARTAYHCNKKPCISCWKDMPRSLRPPGPHDH